MIWLYWALGAVVLLILETLSVDFLFLMLAAGALSAAGIAFVTTSLVAQILTFSIVSVLALVFVRPWVKRYINDSTKADSNVYALTGKSALALTEITEQAGRVNLNGEEWSARAVHGVIPAGARVRIDQIDGVTAVVSLF